VRPNNLLKSSMEFNNDLFFHGAASNEVVY